jgi:SAM-dependent methyltransferase
MNIEDFENLWVDYQPDRADAIDFWNKRAPSFNKRMRQHPSDGHHHSLMEHVARKAGLDRTGDALDIGCGPGGHSLELARLAAHVEGFDISPVMIELAEQNAREDACTNVQFRVLDWAAADIDSLGWRKRFTMVMASRTPAVNNRATLEKMMAASIGGCCMVTHVAMRHSVRDQLTPLLDWDEQKARITRSFFCAFNMLFLMGHYPEVEYFDRAWESQATLEEAELMHLNFFNGITPLSETQKAAVRRKLTEISRNGIIDEKVESKLAVMFWTV